jgi:hypothetical protein
MRLICLPLLLVPLVVALRAEPARAEPDDPCGPFNVPDCKAQKQAPLTFDAIFSSGYAFYCAGDHPYFWSNLNTNTRNFTWDNSCFTVTENIFFEHIDNNSKLDVTISNWCYQQEDITITVACSSEAN